MVERTTSEHGGLREIPREDAPGSSVSDSQTRPRPTFQLLSYSDLLGRPRPTWLFDRLVPSRGFVLLYGRHSSGKSFLSLDMALCLATDAEFADRVGLGGEVVYVVAEGGAGIAQRITAWLVGRPPHVRSLVDARFRVVEVPVQVATEDREALIDAIRTATCTPKLIVLDTLARCAVGLDENSAKEMGLFVAGVGALVQAFDCAVLVVHHTGKDGDDVRGSSALAAAADTVLRMDKVDGHPPQLTLICTKQKDGTEGDPIQFELDVVMLGSDEFGVPETSCRTILAGAARKDPDSLDSMRRSEVAILDVLEGPMFPHGGAATPLAGAANISVKTFYSAASSLADKGWIRVEGPRGRQCYVLARRRDQRPVDPVSENLASSRETATPFLDAQRPLEGRGREREQTETRSQPSTDRGAA